MGGPPSVKPKIFLSLLWSSMNPPRSSKAGEDARGLRKPFGGATNCSCLCDSPTAVSSSFPLECNSPLTVSLLSPPWPHARGTNVKSSAHHRICKKVKQYQRRGFERRGFERRNLTNSGSRRRIKRSFS